jgi:hypothetical protein
VGTRPQKRLGLLRRRSGRQGVELRVGAKNLPPHRGLARRPRPRLPRHRRPGFCPATPRSQPDRTGHGRGRPLGRDPELREPERPHDGGRRRCFAHRCASPRRIPPIRIPFLRFPLPGPTQPDRSHRARWSPE